MELVELVRGAQDAMDRGDYSFAAAACSHAVDTFPACFTAQRMLAEANLELGRTDSAIEHFERALTVDPLNVVARLGLGVSAEEKREMSDAYASYLHAWEINPALDQVRDELVRLRGLLGGDERLHPTRAGLAGIYARSGQYGRAAAEWRAVLMVEPENRQARTSLAEVLWRSGDDLAAAAMCRDALREFPENVRALAMLSEIEHRRGSVSAAELVERYQAVDPLGEIATLMSEWRDGTDLSFLRRESAILPDFDPAAVVQEPVEFAAPTGATGPSGLASGHFAAPDLWDTLVKDLKGDPHAQGGSGAPDADVQPFSWMDEAGPETIPGLDPFSLDGMMESQAELPADLQDALPPIAAAPASEPISLEAELAAIAAPAPKSSTTDIFAPEPELDVAPPPVPTSSGRAAEKSGSDAFVTPDGRVDLTVGWDDLDRQLREATPNFANSAEMDALAAALGVDGIAPFEMGETPFDDSAWAPFTDDEIGVDAGRTGAQPIAVPEPAPFVPPVTPAQPVFAAEPAPAQPAAAVDPAPGLGWDLDDELVSAIPSQQASGYTEMLRHVDTEVPAELGFDGEIDPFANPDSAGVPLEFEDLLAVTSRDGTAPLAAPPELFKEAEQPAWFDDMAALEELVAAGGPDAALGRGLPLDESPRDLEELLRSDATAATEQPASWEVPESSVAADAPAREGAPFWAAPSPVPAAEGPAVDDFAFDAALADLGDLKPFSLEETDSVFVPDAESVDFSDINEAPFDPQSLAQLIAPVDTVDNEAPVLGTEDVAPWELEVTAEAAIIGESGMPSGWDAGALAVEAEAQADPEVPAPRRDGSGFGVPPGGVAWPAFVNHTSELIDRGLAGGGNLFARLREGKRAAAAAGLLTVDRSVAHLRKPSFAEVEDARVQVISVPAAKPASAPLNAAAAAGNRDGGLSQSERLDLMAMRVQLIEDADSAGEVAQRLEAATQQGLNDPLALRVLGEAYLKLGRTEQAAAQFRQAMLARTRAR